MLKLTIIDQIIVHFDQGLRTVLTQPKVITRPNPAHPVAEADLSEAQKRLSARLMRVNHAGEVSAQALYQGQALMARSNMVRDNLQKSAWEENDHLSWCQQRVTELGGHVSWLNPLWYTGSLAIGAIAGAAGDNWSLGFLAETERQVVNHLDNHLQRLPAQDLRSKAILEQMKEDEAKHATVAMKAGGVPLPKPVTWLMGSVSKIMTTTAFWL